MEANNFIFKKKGFLIVFTLLIACQQNSISPLNIGEIESEISFIDAQPIIELRDRGTLDSELFEEIKGNLIESYGTELVNEIKTKLNQEKSNDGLVLIKDLPHKRKSQQVPSTHFKVIEDDVLIDEFVLAVRPFKNSKNMAAKMADSNDDIWIALDPDKFYLEDDEYGNEIWPITIEGNHISDHDRVIELTFDKTGLVSSVEKSMFKSKAIDDPSIIMVETVPVEPCEIQLKSTSSTEDGCQPSGGGGGGGYDPPEVRVDDWSRGESTGTWGTDHINFVLKGVQLAVTGDGGSASDLQFFSKKSDDVLKNMPVSYKYRFDPVARLNPYTASVVNTFIEGADKGFPFNVFYEVPDINYAGQYYSFEGIYRYLTPLPGIVDVQSVDYFPLFNLTRTSGPWRFVLVDDDKDYADMSTRRKDTRIMDVNTFHMDTGTWEVVETGFTTRNHRYGSSDDPLLDSGVRRVTLENVRQLVDGSFELFITRSTSNGEFKYKFGLES
ncbi:MAG: hypothetical protein JJ895_04660 [Balneolaceae bacterium]|nr:hypothetical protein [Balneolaceae bacterium]